MNDYNKNINFSIIKLISTFCIIMLLTTNLLPVVATYEMPQENVTVTTLYETTAQKNWYSETVYSPVCSFHGAVYFVYVGEDLYPYIGKIMNGKTTVNRLSSNDAYKINGDGHHEFSIGVDLSGYIHVTGDMHNFPDAEASNVPQEWMNAKQLYWISNQPEDISSFTFVGNNSSKQMPGTGFSYGFFRTDRNGELFYMTRALAEDKYYLNGGRGLGLYYYSTKTKQWSARGARAPVSNAVNNVLVWEDSGQNGGSYQQYKGDILFDQNNRMHIAVALNNNNSPSVSNYVLYAYSDDLGMTFQRANGAQITNLPMRVDGGDSQGDIVDGNDDADVGQASLSLDKDSRPAINYMYNGSMYYRYWNGANWSSRMVSPISDRAKGFFDEKFGLITLFGTTSDLYQLSAFENPLIQTIHIGDKLRYLDYNAIRNAEGILYGVSWNTSTGDYKVLKLEMNWQKTWGISSVSDANGAVTVHVIKNFDDGSSLPIMIVAAYDRNGRVQSINCKTVEKGVADYIFQMEENAYTAKYKVFLWKDGNSMIPLDDCSIYSVK